MFLAELSDYMGPRFEAICRDWVRLASAAGALPVRVGRVGRWWNPEHEVDVVGLDADGRVAVAGECKWHNDPFAWDDLERFLGHLAAMGARVRPDVTHLLFSRSGYVRRVEAWAARSSARLLTPAELLAPW